MYDRIHAPYMTVHLVYSCQKHRMFTENIWFWTTLPFYNGKSAAILCRSTGLHREVQIQVATATLELRAVVAFLKGPFLALLCQNLKSLILDRDGDGPLGSLTTETQVWLLIGSDKVGLWNVFGCTLIEVTHELRLGLARTIHLYVYTVYIRYF